MAALASLRGYEGGSFPLEYDGGVYKIDESCLAAARHSMKLECLAALDEAMQADTRALGERLEIVLRIAAIVSDEPLDITWSLFGSAGESVAVWTLQQSLSISGADTTTLSEIQQLLSDGDLQNKLLHGVRAERANFIARADHVRAASTIGFSGKLIRDEAFGVRLYNRLLQTPATTLDLVHAHEEASRTLSTNASPLAFLTSSLMVIPTHGLVLQMQAAAHMRCARVGVAAERYRLESGSWPKKLDDLVPACIQEIPEDPFEPGRPVKRVYRDGQLIIYSIGANRKDEKGDATLDRTEGFEADVTFILLDPQLRNRPYAPQSRPATAPAVQ